MKYLRILATHSVYVFGAALVWAICFSIPIAAKDPFFSDPIGARIFGGAVSFAFLLGWAPAMFARVVIDKSTNNNFHHTRTLAYGFAGLATSALLPILFFVSAIGVAAFHNESPDFAGIVFVGSWFAYPGLFAGIAFSRLCPAK